jgi:hypothetical protein
MDLLTRSPLKPSAAGFTAASWASPDGHCTAWQAMAGLMSVNVAAWHFVVDIRTVSYSAIGSLVALQERERSAGFGQCTHLALCYCGMLLRPLRRRGLLLTERQPEPAAWQGVACEHVRC